jgi:hypothetical protein
MMLNNSGGTLIDATQITPDDDEFSRWNSIAVDYEDKVHIVFQDDRREDEHEIYYTKLDPSLDDQDGDAADAATITVIDDRPLTVNDDEKSRHPAISTGCDGHQIHITWEEADLGPDIYYRVLNTNGQTLVYNTALTTGGTADPTTYWTMPYLAVEDDGSAHIVWSDDRYGANEVYYTTYEVDCSTEPIVEPGRITHFYDGADHPDPAVDSRGNVHIVLTYLAQEEVWAGANIYYTMLDNAGNTLIDETRLTPDDDYASKRPAIVVDSNDKVHITWKDYRAEEEADEDEYWEQEIYYTKIDPYLDDRDGDPADEATITLVQDKRISDLFDDYIGACRMAVDSEDNIHVVWEGDSGHGFSMPN